MNKTKKILLGCAALFVGVSSSVAWADADPGFLPTSDEIIVADDDEREEGWDPKLTIGASFALSSNSNFVGQPDGNTFTGGLHLHGRLNYLKEALDWRNSLKIDEVFTRTPVIGQFVKSIDQLAFESILYYRVSDIWGPFASVRLDTNLLHSYDVRSTPIERYELDGDVIETDVKSIQLTSSFQPIQLKEAIGVFVSPINKKSISVDIRGGFGASQTWAEGARIVEADDNAPEFIKLKGLHDVMQGGVVVDVRASGEFEKGRVLYQAHVEAMIPFLNDDPMARSAIDLTNFDIGAKVAFKLFEWASLDYELKVLRLPQLLDEWQVQNNLMLNFSYALID